MPLLFACDDASWDGNVTRTSQEVVSNNGRSLNGVSLNGRSLNGKSLNGKSLNGVSLNGRSLNGRSLNGMSLNGSELRGVTSDGEVVWGTGLVGAVLDGQLSDGDILTIRIDGAQTLPAPNGDVWAYAVSYEVEGAWEPMCGTDAAGAVLAVPLSGTWDYRAGVPGGGSWTESATSFTMACRGAALAKCAELGYKPWSSAGGVSLRGHHQACTRMIRADYCGDGSSNTFNGWSLDVFDSVGVQVKTPGLEGWGFEAHWGADGAMCMSSFRALDLVVSGELPACVAARLSGACTDSGFGDGSLIQNFFDPWGINVALEDAYESYPGAASNLQGAMDLIDQGLSYLSRTPARPRDAAQKIEQAVTKIKSALNKDLPQTLGRDLQRRYALLVRSSLTFEIEKAIVKYGEGSSKVSAARTNLANGDTLLASGDFPNATNRYKNGIGNLY